jgi:hypothetical protein
MAGLVLLEISGILRNFAVYMEGLIIHVPLKIWVNHFRYSYFLRKWYRCSNQILPPLFLTPKRINIFELLNDGLALDVVLSKYAGFVLSVVFVQE